MTRVNELFDGDDADDDYESSEHSQLGVLEENYCYCDKILGCINEYSTFTVSGAARLYLAFADENMTSSMPAADLAVEASIVSSQ